MTPACLLRRPLPQEESEHEYEVTTAKVVLAWPTCLEVRGVLGRYKVNKDEFEHMVWVRYGENLKKGDAIDAGPGLTDPLAIEGEEQPWLVGRDLLGPWKVRGGGWED